MSINVARDLVVGGFVDRSRAHRLIRLSFLWIRSYGGSSVDDFENISLFVVASIDLPLVNRK